MKNVFSRLLTGALLLGVGSLTTSCFTTQESAAEVDRPRVSNQITTDAERQAAYNSGAGYGGSVPDATPGRVRLGEQASGINSRKRPETLNTNDPNTTPNETRLNRLNGAPAQAVPRP
jgi:hypothetical protein